MYKHSMLNEDPALSVAWGTGQSNTPAQRFLDQFGGSTKQATQKRGQQNKHIQSSESSSEQEHMLSLRF